MPLLLSLLLSLQLLLLLLLTHHQDLLWLHCLAADCEACTAIRDAPDSLLSQHVAAAEKGCLPSSDDVMLLQLFLETIPYYILPMSKLERAVHAAMCRKPSMRQIQHRFHGRHALPACISRSLL